ncbi:3-deoxy-8-phosphooctulonate synthase [Methylobacterium gnaphalii]|uniref:2-dehydro-3-deoxyphosphooctonate aldolase n=1 Tax=Methylobacterium gnaphalii TaxID=1010610 RepID=A0A512JN15_9HYPH|nr:3-deoxy-8-phosphooctulonate synthase [Methylobacterium gnaphalii]GEP11322.1 2-dehydro-3-deoxyphosphooctonate aldolase [Methylobacterium gnaphalii]GJD67170.1 2-dehydro-3-deoxyphosphooctonate aldolase [Methylobacterium gnaphalii]GLS50022.1 2-dehydro-3-deoxyphosphooctonate aldolase [Methylobacterium gnaphalii]
MSQHAAPGPVVHAGTVAFANHLPFALIAGPCQLESRDHAFEVASALKEIAEQLGIGLVFKSSFDKANRTSGSTARGIGLDGALPIFSEIKERLGLPVLTDVHEAEQCARAAEVVDVLQIPAFLCRQTDLLLAAAATGRVVNVKKGQFLAPWDMAHVAAKVTTAGNPNVLVTERGASFGYNTLVSDMRSLPIMARVTGGAPVVFDATHSVQQPGGQGATSGGQREFVPVLARAAVAVGVAGLFIETHEDPDNAPSDGPNMVPLKAMPALLAELQAFDRLVKHRTDV